MHEHYIKKRELDSRSVLMTNCYVTLPRTHDCAFFCSGLHMSVSCLYSCFPVSLNMQNRGICIGSSPMLSTIVGAIISEIRMRQLGRSVKL